MKVALATTLAVFGVLFASPVSAAKEAKTPVQATAVTGKPTPYRINPGDEIEIYVWGEERLQRVIKVLPDGSFSFPLAGRIEAAGKLPSEVETAISTGLRPQFRDQVPQVTVSVRSPMMQFSIIGKVRSPGTFTPGKYVNILEAIGMAGGPTDFADTSNVLILRKDPNGTLTPMRVRLNDALKGNPSSRDLGGVGLPQIQPGDTVIVP